MSIKIFPFVKFDKVIQIYEVLSVWIAVPYHLFGFFKCQLFVKLLSASKQILRGDKSLVFLIKVFKNSLYVFSSIVLVWLLGH